MKIETIKHRGKEILVVDFTGCSSLEDRMDLMDQTGKTINKMPDHSVLNVALFNGQKMNQELMERASYWTRKNQNKFKKSAIVGISGLQTIFLNTLNRINNKSKLKAFKTQEEALQYLID